MVCIRYKNCTIHAKQNAFPIYFQGREEHMLISAPHLKAMKNKNEHPDSWRDLNIHEHTAHQSD